jgi:hypothetical protein
MCLDSEFANWGAAWSAHKPPKVTRVGIGYVLRGDVGVGNTDPFATSPTPDNQWVKSGPHVMVVVPNVAQLADSPTDPKDRRTLGHVEGNSVRARHGAGSSRRPSGNASATTAGADGGSHLGPTVRSST